MLFLLAIAAAARCPRLVRPESATLEVDKSALVLAFDCCVGELSLAKSSRDLVE